MQAHPVVVVALAQVADAGIAEYPDNHVARFRRTRNPFYRDRDCA